ncbi:MAG: pyridoxamine 5'-phosphate oxidase family protein [Pseudomonadota bacterium]
MSDETYSSLAAIEDWIGASLIRAAVDKRAAFRWPVLSTIADGALPSSRVVVMRRYDPKNRKITIYTDGRSAKVDQIRSNENVALLFFDQRRSIQLRVNGVAKIHKDDDVRKQALSALPLTRQSDYATEAAPGSVQQSSETAYLSENASENFCVITVKANTADWLWLNRDGHRRALFEWKEGQTERFWVTP